MLRNTSLIQSVPFNIKGVVAPVFTPVDEDGHLDVGVINSYTQYLVNNGVSAILVGGTTGEFVTLSVAERKALLTAWLDAARANNVKVIAQVGGVPFPEVIEMAKFAEEKQADAILTLPELYFKPRGPEQLVDYLELVSAAAPSLPLIYYHFPMMSGVNMNMAKFFSLASARIPNFKGMKADLDAAVQVVDILGEDQRIFIGNHLIAPAVLLGHECSIATVTNLFPDLVLAIVDATKRGEVSLVRELQGKMNRLVDAIASQGEFLPAMKVAMPMVTGIRVGSPRKPMTSLDMEQRNRVEENLKNLNIDIIRTE